MLNLMNNALGKYLHIMFLRGYLIFQMLLISFWAMTCSYYLNDGPLPAIPLSEEQLTIHLDS